MPRLFRTLRVVCWLALVGVTAGAWAASDRVLRAARRTSAVAVRADVTYRDADGHRLALDVYLPPAGAPRLAPGPGRPAILAIHGGSWIGGSRRMFRPDPGPWDPRPSMAVQLAESGFVVVAPDYRVSRPGAPDGRAPATTCARPSAGSDATPPSWTSTPAGSRRSGSRPAAISPRCSGSPPTSPTTPASPP